MTDEKKNGYEQKIEDGYAKMEKAHAANEAAHKVDPEVGKLINEAASLGGKNRELTEQVKKLEEDAHEFSRKHLAMSTLVSLLMKIQHGDGKVHLDQNEFVRLATEATTAQEDNGKLRRDIARCKEDMQLMEMKFVAKRIALHEEIGGKLAELIKERDALKEAVGSSGDDRDDGAKRSCKMDIEDSERIMKEDLIKGSGPGLRDLFVLLLSLSDYRFVEIIKECQATALLEDDHTGIPVGADASKILSYVKRCVVDMMKNKKSVTTEHAHLPVGDGVLSRTDMKE